MLIVSWFVCVGTTKTAKTRKTYIENRKTALISWQKPQTAANLETEKPHEISEKTEKPHEKSAKTAKPQTTDTPP